MSTEDSMVKKTVSGRTDAYAEYRGYEPIQNVGTGVVGKVRKGISYYYALQHGS